MVSKKVGSVLLVVGILIFLISGLSAVYNELDQVTGQTSISAELQDYENNVSTDTKSFNDEYNLKVDETGDFVQPEDSQVEQRGADSSGIINARGKSIITKFLYLVFDKLDIPRSVSFFILFMVVSTISILFIRFFWGDSRV